MRLTTVAFAVTVAVALAALPATAVAVDCQSITSFDEWQCRYSPNPQGWSWQNIVVGTRQFFCQGGESSTGRTTECFREAFLPCNICVPDRPCTDCGKGQTRECPRPPDDQCGGFIPSPSRRAWLLADGEAGVETPDPSVSYNSEGAVNTVTNLELGKYEVRFPELGGFDGNMQVAAYGEGNARCKLTGWFGLPEQKGPGDLTASVWCHTPEGTLTSSPFVISFIATQNLFTPHAELAYVFFSPWAEEVQTEFLWSTQATLPIVTKQEAGYYTVRLEGHLHEDPSVFVTAMGGDASFCQHVYSAVDGSGTTVGVFCYDSSGRLFDTAFSARVEWREPPGQQRAGYVLANKSTVSSYTPVGQYNSAGQTNTAARAGVGDYSARYPKLAGKDTPWDETTSTVMVTASALGPLYCKAGKWAKDNGAIVAATRCFNVKGAPANSGYHHAYVSFDPFDVIGP